MSKSTDVAKVSTLDRLRANKGELSKLNYNELMAQVDTADVVDAAEALGNGFTIASEKDKAKLVNVPFVIVDWRVNENGRFGPFFTLFIITADNRKLILNDGGSGIGEQLAQLSDAGFDGLIQCRHGLTVSEYPAFENAYDANGDPVIDEKTGKQQRKPLIDPATGQQVVGKTYRLNLDRE